MYSGNSPWIISNEKCLGRCRPEEIPPSVDKFGIPRARVGAVPLVPFFPTEERKRVRTDAYDISIEGCWPVAPGCLSVPEYGVSSKYHIIS